MCEPPLPFEVLVGELGRGIKRFCVVESRTDLSVGRPLHYDVRRYTPDES